MDAIAMHRARLLPTPEDDVTSAYANAKDRRASQAAASPQGSQLERLSARFNALQALPEHPETPQENAGDLLPSTMTLPASPDAKAPQAHRELSAVANEECGKNAGGDVEESAENNEENPKADVPEEQKPSGQQPQRHTLATVVSPFASTVRTMGAAYPPPRHPSASALPSSSAPLSSSALAPSSASRSASARSSASALASATTVAAVASAFAMTRATPPVTAASSNSAVGDAPAVIDGIVSRLADFCADPAVFERGAWHVTVPLQTVLPDCVLHVALSHFDLTLRFETSSESARNVLLQHASTLRERLTALLKAKQTTPRGIEIIVR